MNSNQFIKRERGVIFKPVHKHFHGEIDEVHAISLAFRTPSGNEGSRVHSWARWGRTCHRLHSSLDTPNPGHRWTDAKLDHMLNWHVEEETTQKWVKENPLIPLSTLPPEWSFWLGEEGPVTLLFEKKIFLKFVKKGGGVNEHISRITEKNFDLL